MDNRPFDEILKNSVNTTRNYTFEEADWLMLKKQLPKKTTLWQKYWAWMVGSFVITGLVVWNITLGYQVKHLSQIITEANIIQKTRLEQKDTTFVKPRQSIINEHANKYALQERSTGSVSSFIDRKRVSVFEFLSLADTSELGRLIPDQSSSDDYDSHSFEAKKDNWGSGFQLDSLEKISTAQNSLERQRGSDQKKVGAKSASDPNEKKGNQYMRLEKIPTIPLGNESIYTTVVNRTPLRNENSFITNNQQKKKSTNLKKECRIKVGASIDISTSGNNNHVVTSKYSINSYSANWAYGLSAGINILPLTSLELGASKLKHSSVHAPANAVPAYYPQVNDLPDNAQLQYANVDIEHIQFSLSMRKQWLAFKKVYPYAELGWMPYRTYSRGRISYMRIKS